MRDDSEKTQEKYFQYTAAQDASYRSVQSIPSLQNKTDKSAITNAKKKLDTERGAKVNKWNRNSVRLTVSCGECGKKRCIFSKLSQSDEVKGQLGSFLEDMEYFICGDSLFVEAEDGAHPLSLIFFNRINLTCADHMEPEYYHTTNLVKGGDECSYCLSQTDILNETELKQKKLLNGYKNLPIFKACCDSGFKLPTYGVKRAGEAATQVRQRKKRNKRTAAVLDDRTSFLAIEDMEASALNDHTEQEDAPNAEEALVCCCGDNCRKVDVEDAPDWCYCYSCGEYCHDECSTIIDSRKTCNNCASDILQDS
jgi:hypothetical protein